ncbi:LacI family DNA-binding transcriptional regulator [Thalassospira mesophila]|uniref:LacI family DNA-binding transcriptional regulator n=1 Tax=Thalassospira mesophila TaxID=1293891 RepID=UPI000A1F2E92|nr:LacI family DNA-binding transcriptional regulator [Thalassospira mesophila]
MNTAKKDQTKHKVTSRDVAERAGVSRSAVSRSFTPGAYVSETIRKKVHIAAKDLGYLPNALARSLIGGGSSLVALIIGPMASPHDSLLIEAVTCKLAELGKRVLLVPVPATRVADDSLLEALSYQVEAAVVFAGTVGQQAAERCTRIGTRLILFGRVVDVPDTCCIIYDNVAAAQAAGRYLLRSGHRKIAYIGTRHNAFSDRERHAGLSHVLHEAGLEIHAFEKGDYGHDSGYQAALKMLGSMDPPDAIFSSNDGMALGAIDAARALGIRIPNDLAVIGIDNNPMGDWAAYRLTSWGLPADDIAKVIADEIIHKTAPENNDGDTDVDATANHPRTIRLPLTLTLRETTRRMTS